MAFSLSRLKNIVANVARNQYFLLKMPGIFEDENILTAMVRTTELPAMTHTTVDIPVRGMMTRHMGTATYNDWSVTFLCDEDHALRETFVMWQMLAANPGMASFTTNNYKKDEITIWQIKQDNSTPTATATFYGMFPYNIGPIAYDQAGGDFCTFDVTFFYDYYVIIDLLPELKNLYASPPQKAEEQVVAPIVPPVVPAPPPAVNKEANVAEKTTSPAENAPTPKSEPEAPPAKVVEAPAPPKPLSKKTQKLLDEFNKTKQAYFSDPKYKTYKELEQYNKDRVNAGAKRAEIIQNTNDTINFHDKHLIKYTNKLDELREKLAKEGQSVHYFY